MLQKQSLAGKWEFRQASQRRGEWLPAQVPGGVHTDLMAAGKIPDPFVADNEKRVMWVAESDWEYRAAFTPQPGILKEKKVFLVFDGLDTLAEVRLNGKLLGKTDNMYRQYRWEVKALLREGQNELAIFFPALMHYMTERQAERPMRGVSQALPGGPHVRKAPCHFGWDWGPMLPPIGVWKDVRLEGRSQAEFEDVHVRQRHTDWKATVEVEVKVTAWQPGPLTALVRLTAPDGKVVEAITQVAGADPAGAPASLLIPVENPRLWWPNGYGEQPLYGVQVSLMDGDTLLDQREYKVGLRTLELRQVEDEWGRSFTFVVNGVPVFAKGSNWIPTDSFPTRITDTFLEKIIADAAATHQNMLRVWGGGLYEEDRFYDLCDRYGILVWQDYIFSCSIYPLDEQKFLDNVQVEVVQNVRRLRHHASLALWCGNNEMEMGWEAWGWSKVEIDATWRSQLDALAQSMPYLKMLLEMYDHTEALPGWQGLREAYERFFFHTLPAWIVPLDPDTPYWPSSPSSNTPFQDVNGQRQGDAHYWDVWHGRKPFTAYRAQYPRFMSEFGFQSLPPLETIRTYAPESEWNMTSYMMEHHQRSFSGNGLMIAQMTDTFRMPKDFPALVYLSMMLQAEGIRYGVEHWRRNRRRVSGTLYWQLNDCWPVASWSSLDYFGRWKALHYAARRFYAPLLLSIEDHVKPADADTLASFSVDETQTQMDVHVTSDLQTAWQGEIAWTLETLDGETLQKGQAKVMAQPLANTPVCSVSFPDQVSDANRRQVVFVCELRQGEQRLALSVTPFVAHKHLALSDPDLRIGAQIEGRQLVLEVSAHSLARFVELSLDGRDVVFSDNYFDVPAGRTVKVTCALPEEWGLEEVGQALKARSLYDS